jgi:hypothetical protein
LERIHPRDGYRGRGACGGYGDTKISDDFSSRLSYFSADAAAGVLNPEIGASLAHEAIKLLSNDWRLMPKKDQN